MEPIILASASPRRQEYLKLLGLPFSCMPSSIDEDIDEYASPEAAAEDLARKKVINVLEKLKNEPPLWVLGADTIVTLDGTIYGKPRDREDARAMIAALEGRKHRVITALALYKGSTKTMDYRQAESTVFFAPMAKNEIEWYLNSNEWQDAAGAYKIQGLASCFISEIHGSFSSIVGLPLRDFYAILKDNGYHYGG